MLKFKHLDIKGGEHMTIYDLIDDDMRLAPFCMVLI